MSEERTYPRSMTCKHGFVVNVRPMLAEDIPKLVEMYKLLNDKERALLTRDVLDPYFIQQVTRELEDGRVHRLGAWHEDEMVGQIILRRGHARWVQHTCTARINTSPKYRRYRIATVLFEEVVPFARSNNIEKIYAQLLEEQDAAKEMVKSVGFKREAVLKHNIKDQYGRYHDMIIYSIDLEAAHKAMEALMAGFADYSG